MQLQDILTSISDEDVEHVYESVNGKINSDEGIGAFEKIKGIMYAFRSAYMAKGQQKNMHRSYVSLEKNYKVISGKLDIHLRETSEKRQTTIPKEEATELVSNLHLVLNGFRELAKSIDRDEL